MVLYHVTSQEKADQILKEGLTPKIGENSTLAGEEKALVYLCRKKDVPYWQILLGERTVLQVKADDLDLQPVDYQVYMEYRFNSRINASDIKQVPFPEPTSKHMRKLCLEYMGTLSFVCLAAARHYNGNKSYTSEILTLLFHTVLAVKGRLNWDVLTESEIRKKLLTLGDGNYTFCDTYRNTDRRLWEQLIYYPDDELTPLRREVHDYIRNEVKRCLYTDTGGWTG